MADSQSNVPQEATCFVLSLTRSLPINKASVVEIELGLSVVITVAIQRVTGSLQKERWTLTQACPIENATKTRNPMNTVVWRCFRPLPNNLEI